MALRLSKIKEAFESQNLISAVLESEEILDEEPDNIEALAMLGDVELELGHGQEAKLVFSHLCELSKDQTHFMNGLAMAHFLCVEYEKCYEITQSVLKLDPNLAEAHAYAALSLERLNRPVEADYHNSMAETLNPQYYKPPTFDQIPWDDLLLEAISKLPDYLSDFFDNVSFVWTTYPPPQTLLSNKPNISPLILALYEGRPTEETRELGIYPRSIRLFKGNMVRFSQNFDQLALDLSQALASEAIDWIGKQGTEE